jgi:uncharacterized phage protein (TIGR01671 family)
MKRKIKFRVFTNGRMEYNVGLREDGTPYKAIPSEYYELEKDKDFSKDVPLMQFTERKDKNGQDIYESDVVEFNERGGGIGEVRIIGGKWKIYYSDVSDTYHNKPDNLMPIKDLEVVGNIYENPRLLK